MSGTDGEGSVGPDADFVDATAETEVELRLPLEVDMKPDQHREDDLPTRGPLIRMRLISVKMSSADSSPQTGLNRNGPDTGCRCLERWSGSGNDGLI